MASAILLPFLHPRFGALVPISAPFKLVTVPVVLTSIAFFVPPVRTLYNALLGTSIPQKFSWRNKEHIRHFFVVFGINELLVQLILAPLLFPLPRPNPLMGKLTFASGLDVPFTAYTIMTLMFIPQLASRFSTNLGITNKGTAALASRVMMLMGFMVAGALRDNSTPLDIITAGVLTVQTFALVKYDKIGKLIFGGAIPPFDIESKDSIVLAGVLFGTWLMVALQFLHDTPGYKEVTAVLQRILHGNEHLRIIGKLIELGALYAVPAMVASKRSGDYSFAYSSMFLTMLFVSKMIPARVMKMASSLNGGGVKGVAKSMVRSF